MRLLLLFLLSSNLFAQLGIKGSIIENPFSLPSDISNFQVENIAKNTESLELNFATKLKKRKAFSFSFINKFNLNSTLFNTDLITNKSKYNLKNRDDVNDNIKDLSVSISSLAYKKIAKRTVLFLNAEFKYSDGYNLEYDLRAVNSKVYDYFLISNENISFSTGFGVQSKVSRKVRLDANYSLKIDDYFYDYSIYDINKDQEEDNITHSLLVNLNYKFSKVFDIDLKSYASFKIYKNKLALKENGYIVVQGFAQAEELLDLSQTVSFNLKLNKVFSTSFDIGKFVRVDDVSGARDVSIDSYKASFAYRSRFSLIGSFEYKKLHYDNQIASLVDESDLEGLLSTTRELVLGVSYRKVGLNFTNINTNSTREYDSINHNRYDLSYSIAI